ncbi:ATPase [Acidothermaceae bacterium B102]|nr:ATPase [Acidothermaceae bacterium B102]
MSPRGYRGKGNGRVSYVEAPPEWRGTTVQVCGLFPWTAGASAPIIGVPLGPHLRTGATVCFDVINWFQRARYILNPSMFVLGLPGLGKSTFVRRQITGLAAGGVVPLVLGDLKPDYADLVVALGGQVIKLGRGLGSLNVLDVGALEAAADVLEIAAHEADVAGQGRRADEIAKAAVRLREESHGRRLNMVVALVLIVRGRIEDYEQTVLSVAIRELSGQHGDLPPTLHDLVALLDEGPPAIRAVTLDRGSDERYRDAIDPLQRTLLGLVDGPLGDVFARQTTSRIRLDSTAVCVDVSSISESDTQLQAAVLLACWNDGFGAVEAANALADVGVGPQRRFMIIMDELWRVLRAGAGMVDRINALTRLNRNDGVGTAMITHTMADLRALALPADIAKAKGFIERSGAVVCGGLPSSELDELQDIVRFTQEERRMVTEWSTPTTWGTGHDADIPAGVGDFLIKVGQRPGVPVHVQLTDVEMRSDVHNTNKRWGG